MKQPSRKLLPGRSVFLPTRSQLIRCASRLSRLLLTITFVLAGAAASPLKATTTIPSRPQSAAVER
jgi:hypothetical protein